LKTDNSVCHVMKSGEVLNAHKSDSPLFYAVLYGDKTLCEKFSKRLSCSIKHLPIRLKFSYEYSTQKAIDLGITKDPTLVLNGKIFLEGLFQAEDITATFEKWLKDYKVV